MSYAPADTFLPWDWDDFGSLSVRRMPHRFSIRRPTSTPDGSGGSVDVLTEVATTRGALTRLLTPREITLGGGMAGVADYRLLVPLDTDLQPTDDVLPWYLWRVSLGPATAGSFTLSYSGYTTATIAYNATPATVAARLERLASIRPGNVSGLGAAGGPYQIRLKGALTANELPLTANFAGLTGGDAVLERPAFNVMQTDEGLTEAPQMTVYLTRRRP